MGHDFALADCTLKEQLDLKTRMEDPAPLEGQSQLPSPHYSSLRKAMAAALVLDGESTMGRRKKKKKESRPESIIIYRSESETLDEEPGESEGGNQPKEEEGEDFLDYPVDDGESLWGHLLKATGRRSSKDPWPECPEDRLGIQSLTYFLLIHFFSKCCRLHPTSQQCLLSIYCGSLLGDMEENSTFLKLLV